MTKTRKLLLALLPTALLALTGCVSMPSGGPVQAYAVTQGTDAQSQQFMQVQPQPPGAGWNPQQIVQGFLTASAAFGSYGPKIAQEYLTPQEQKNWTNTKWSALVYQSGPTVKQPVYLPSQKKPRTATVDIGGSVEATLKGTSGYSVNSSSQVSQVQEFGLQLLGGQWRISSAPEYLLLSSDSFHYDYQLANLYFFDPAGAHLVPDPVYVPVGDSQRDLVTLMVNELIKQPTDWLQYQGATHTAIPAGTVIGGIVVSGATAVVNLKGAKISKASATTLAQVSAQLWSTLKGAGQGRQSGQQVKSVELELNGTPWIPPESTGGNPVSPPGNTYNTPLRVGKSGSFYYVDAAGYLTAENAKDAVHRLGKIGTGYTQLAISPDETSVAALRGSDLYAGGTTGPLARLGTGYTAISWDSSDNLWAASAAQIVLFRGGQGQPVRVSVPNSAAGLGNAGYTALKVAPDGVRVAIIQNNDLLTFGSVSGLQGLDPEIYLSPVQEMPENQTFRGLAWYGSDDVITLASGSTGPTVTEYPVSGAAEQSLPAESGMQAIAASYQRPLVAGVSVVGVHGDELVSAGSPSDSWSSIPGANGAPAKGATPVYPG